MADSKISALPASTTPLAGTEVLPIVQSGATKQVSVVNLTAGRALSAAELTLSTGNLIIGTSGKGIDFSATPGTGTSELLSDYEEGTWTPSVGGTATYTTQSGKYIRVGNAVSFNGRLKINSLGTGSAFLITGLPFTSSNDGIGSSVHIGIWAGLGTTPVYVSGYVYPNFAGFELQGTIAGTATLSALSVLVNSAEVYFSGTYFV